MWHLIPAKGYLSHIGARDNLQLLVVTYTYCIIVLVAAMISVRAVVYVQHSGRLLFSKIRSALRSAFHLFNQLIIVVQLPDTSAQTVTLHSDSWCSLFLLLNVCHTAKQWHPNRIYSCICICRYPE